MHRHSSLLVATLSLVVLFNGRCLKLESKNLAKTLREGSRKCFFRFFRSGISCCGRVHPLKLRRGGSRCGLSAVCNRIYSEISNRYLN